MQTERQTQIIETSIEIISQKGIQGLTIKNLSKKIGISEPAIYRHFDSKTEILVTILNNFKEMATFLGGLMKNNDSSAAEKIEFMFSRIIAIFSETPSLISVIFSEEIFKNEEILKNKIVEIMDMNEEIIEQEKDVREELEAEATNKLDENFWILANTLAKPPIFPPTKTE